MNIIQLTPGAGAMFCGNCLRDNALVAALRQLGHRVTLVPLYLPLTLDQEDQSAGTPIFFGGINVYLEQKSELFRHAPAWLRHLFSWRPLLRWAAGKAAKTRASELGELTLSMLRGEAGNQAGELDELIQWVLHTQPPDDVVCLSNALLLGQARRLKSELRAPLVCTLQGEDSFLDALPPTHRAACWQTLAERAAEVDAFIAPSSYFAKVMSERLGLPSARIHMVHNGIDLAGYSPPPAPVPGFSENNPPHSALATLHSSLDTRPVLRSTSSVALRRVDRTAARGHSPPVLGYFARMCREKGLAALVEAFVILRRRERTKGLKLRIGGSCGPADEPFVSSLRERLKQEALLEAVEFHPNLDRAAKLSFLRGLSVFSVPALYGEAFGLYLIEAMAAGVPVVQPQTAAFPELIEATGGGVLCAPGDPKALADAIESLLLDPDRAGALGQAGARAVFEKFSAQSMARACLRVFEDLRSSREHPQPLGAPARSDGGPTRNLQPN